MHKEPKYCKDCKWSKPEENYIWSLRCVNHWLEYQASNPQLFGEIW